MINVLNIDVNTMEMVKQLYAKTAYVAHVIQQIQTCKDDSEILDKKLDEFVDIYSASLHQNCLLILLTWP